MLSGLDRSCSYIVIYSGYSKVEKNL
jgi:hypothetical protein